MANLFMFTRGLGGTIMTTGVVDLYKDEPAVIVTTPQTAPLFEDLPNLERIILRGRKPWQGHWVDIWKEVRGRPWNRIVAFKGEALALALKANKKYIWTPRCINLIHRVEQISRSCGSRVPLPPILWLSEERLARVRCPRPILAVAPIPSWIGKQWPLEHFITLMRLFCKTYPEAQVAVFAAPHERELAAPLLQSLPQDQCIDTLGGHLLDSAALIQKSRVFLGNDSGLMHLSAAVNTPTIALFGPSDERIFGPWAPPHKPSPHRVVRGAHFTGHVAQNPLDRKCYMHAVTVSQVWEVLQERWENVTGQGAC